MGLDKTAGEWIKKAQEHGNFDNLPGEGKPLDLSVYIETHKSEKRLPFHVMMERQKRRGKRS
jgi:hypothetical protein